ncbi:MAG: substrate-binding domain-containing protein [Chloroflexia bacterium]|nr:substrate-binding domain-containing protein [Chloroflexia bacterium]
MKTWRRAAGFWPALAGSLLVVALVAALPAQADAGAQATPAGPRDVILATTTSTADSGLLDVLVPMFAERTGYNLAPIAVGSGAAIELGTRGEADVLLVHSPRAEAEFMDSGAGARRELVMFNDFVIVGPPGDPVAITAAATAADAMATIARNEATFISRGDDSGTHARELALWEQAGIDPAGGWYVESGTGMGDTLNIASERQAYTLADRGTYLALRDRLDLEVLVENDSALLNVYHVITVDPAQSDTINVAGATAFADFLLAPETQAVIGQFGVEEFGEPLFTPCAANSCGRFAEEATPVASPVATPASARP